MANPSAIALAKAKLIPLLDNDAEADESRHIKVQFNPSSLKVTLANTLKSDSRGGDSGSAAQYVDKSSSTLAIELLFDTTIEHDGVAANSDVRLQTQKIAEAFMKPIEGSDNRLRAPARCRFQWGAFKFVGMVGSYNETLDYFSPEGIPLRAKLSLSLKEDKYQFERDASIQANRPQNTNFFSAAQALNNSTKKQTAPGQSVNSAQRSAGQPATQAKQTALVNGIENPRDAGGQPLQVPTQKLAVPESRQMDGSRASPGFSHGRSESLGSRIPGAFRDPNANSANPQIQSHQQQAELAKQRLQRARKRIRDLNDN